MKDDLPSKHTLKEDICCIIDSVDILPKTFDIALYIEKLKRFFLDKWYCFQIEKLYQIKRVFFQQWSSSVNEKT